jgi:hypothetical protein
MKTLDDLQLSGDDVLSLRDFYHGSIRMALNTCGIHHIDILPMFEVLRSDMKLIPFFFLVMHMVNSKVMIIVTIRVFECIILLDR